MTSLAAGGLGFVLFGPRGGKDRSDGRLVLDYWEKWTGVEGRAMQKIVQDFNDSQSRIFVRYFSTNAIDQKTQVAIAGGNPPDIVGLWNYNIPAYAEMGAILPLSEIDCAPAHRVNLDRYAAAMRPVMQYKGKIWGAINTGGTLALYYNKAHFKEAGLDPSKPPLTIDDLNRCNHKLTKVAPSGSVIRAGFVHPEPGWWSFIWGFYFGGSLYEESTQKCLLNSPENVIGYEWLSSYSSRFGSGDDLPDADPQTNKALRSSSLAELEKFRSGFGNYDSSLNAFLSGKISMVIQGPWLANVINTHKPDVDYGVTPFPVVAAMFDPDRPIGLIDTDILVIPRGVKHPEACMEFVAYTQQQHVVEHLSTVHCKNSTLAAVSDDFITKHPNRGVRTFATIANSPRGYICPPTRTWLQFKDIMDSNMQKIWTQKAPVKTLLELAHTRVQQVLDQAATAANHRKKNSVQG